MKVSTAVIAFLWIYAIASVVWKTFSPEPAIPNELLSVKLPWVVQLLPFPFFVVIAFFAPHSPFFNARLASFIDSLVGPQAFETFVVRLKPLLLFGVSGLLGSCGLVWRGLERGESANQGLNIFFLAGSVGFLLAHAILRIRKVQGV